MRSLALSPLFLLLVVSQRLSAQCEPGPIERLIPEGTVAGDWVVHPEVDGNWMVVGAPFADGTATNSGAAYVYSRDASGGWSLVTTLAPPDLVSGDWFGKHATIQGDCIVVGATGEWLGSATGKAYVFRFDGTSWNQEAKLVPSDAPADGRFGSGVSVDGNYIIVGAYKAHGTGRAYIFEFVSGTWIEREILQSPDPCGSDSFASHSCILVGDRAFVGSRYDSQQGSGAGAAFVFRRLGNTWMFEDKLLASDGGPGRGFGWWLDAYGEEVVVGAPSAGAGEAYIFESTESGWVEKARLSAPGASGGDNFGYWASIHGAWAAVGARYADAQGVDSGSAYLYRKVDDDWEFHSEVLPQELEAGDQLGNVSIDGTTLAVGAIGDDDAGTDAGAIYVSDLPRPPVAACEVVPMQGKAPLTVTFVDHSEGDVTSWHWDFGNGYSSTVQNPVFTYNEAGSFSVTLTVTGPCGSSTYSMSDPVVVKPRIPHAQRSP